MNNVDFIKELDVMPHMFYVENSLISLEYRCWFCSGYTYELYDAREDKALYGEILKETDTRRKGGGWVRKEEIWRWLNRGLIEWIE